MRIRHKNNGTERDVTPKQWEAIKSNPDIKRLYEVIEAPAAPTEKAPPPEEVLAKDYEGLSLEELQNLCKDAGIEYSGNMKEKTLIKLLVQNRTAE